jgi:ribonuclease HI
MPEFTCVVCETTFTLSDEVMGRYPGWKPRYCRDHKGGKKTKGTRSAPTRLPRGPSGGQRKRGGGSSATREENLPVAEVLRRYTGGPADGLFTDGGCTPNPGPGGWGAVWVQDGEIVEQRHGHDPDTTNNRMELTALIQALRLLSKDAEVTVYSDSQLCIKSISEWAAGWERRGWKRKAGPIKNLELIQELYALKQERPKVRLQWIAAHSGNRWNEYADSLASAWSRSEL